MQIILQIVRKKFTLDDTFSIEIERDENEKRIYLVNEHLQTFRLMATFIIGSGRWVFKNYDIADEFIKLAKKNPSIKNNIHKEMPLPYEIGLEKMFTCFKRRWHVRIVRIGTKLKHLI